MIKCKIFIQEIAGEQLDHNFSHFINLPIAPRVKDIIFFDRERYDDTLKEYIDFQNKKGVTVFKEASNRLLSGSYAELFSKVDEVWIQEGQSYIDVFLTEE